MTHICVGKLTIIGSDNGLSPGRRQAILWTNAGLLLIGPLGTNFSEILIKILTFSFKKMRLKVSSAKRRPFCLGLNVLNVSTIRSWTVISNSIYRIKSAISLKFIKRWCHGDTTCIIGPWIVCLNSMQANNKDIIKTMHYLPFLLGTMGNRWLPYTLGQWYGKSVHVMISSLTRCGLVTPYGDIELGQYWFR